MNIQELSPTNWVLLNIHGKDEPYQVECADLDDEGRVYVKDLWFGFDVEKLKPVPLTLDLLITNGFTKNPYAPNVYWYRDFYIRLLPEHNVIGGHAFDVEYVHQLQNLMRSIGFEELADNFVVQ